MERALYGLHAADFTETNGFKSHGTFHKVQKQIDKCKWATLVSSAMTPLTHHHHHHHAMSVWAGNHG
jgi:hypothetical protein